MTERQEQIIRGRAVVPGCAAGTALVASEPLSFWGGFDQSSGEVIDRHHELSGQIARHRILAIPSTRGSSTTTAVLLEAVRQGNAPAALVTRGVDTFLALASVVADELYSHSLPVIALSAQDYASLRTGQHVRILPDGTLHLNC